MTFTAIGGLPALTTNVVRIGTNATDSVSGNALYAPFETYFVTAATTGTDASPPAVTITTPFDGAILTGAVNVSGIASDDVSVAAVEIRLDVGGWMPAVGTTNWSVTLETGHFLNGSHLLSARATDTSGNVSSLDSILVRVRNASGDYLQRVSAGSFNDVTDCDNNIWSKDRPYAVGAFGFTGGSPGFVGDMIAGIPCVSGQLIFQRDRTGTNSFAYAFDCPAGLYETTLLLAETRTNAPNGNVFSVFVQGQQVLTNLDVFTAAGGMDKPLIRVFTNAVPNAQLVVQFIPVINRARASGIQVRKIAELDTDGDGIPDWWMLGYFNHATGDANDNSMPAQDADGDGLSNLREFLAGTDPTDANSSFRITDISIAGNDLVVTWMAAPGRTNQLQRSGTVDGSGAWLNIGPSLIPTGSLAVQADVGGLTNPAGFYRVRLMP